MTVIGGLHDVRLALRNQPDEVRGVYLDARRDDKRVAEIVALAKHSGVPLTRVSRRELDDMSAGLRHQGVIAQCDGARSLRAAGLESFLVNLDHDPLLLVLDGVQDPHNLGACLRTADAAGVDAVIVPQDRSCKITPAVSRVAAGAVHALPFYAVSNLGRTLSMLKDRGVWLTGASDRAERVLWDADLAGPIAIVLGAEGSGLRELTREHCDFLVGIPMVGQVESLNVSVAAGVILFEAVRQRGLRIPPPE
ncbi:MAG: 23S rRNA (guanosine(2251)-2'-O)-methyltransferase RlmB [Proteobacteria bacterium]|nr:MAG: 23S rRNA (guanosine(2251)-2'-O)-methyltransferase RlmB [Pseudomonadota bacterium]